MKKLGIFVGENENSTFFKEISEDLSSHYQVEHFQKKTLRLPVLSHRVNDKLYRDGIRLGITAE